ncbi:hypothetical protein OKW21_003594 [Catalinimonas alkaloidigena]|nr:hypothetical protein [Catalinimonas alkaloidigena]
MEKIINTAVKIVNVQAYKETHGLYINGQLHHLGTEAECNFMRLTLLANRKAKK